MVQYRMLKPTNMLGKTIMKTWSTWENSCLVCHGVLGFGLGLAGDGGVRLWVEPDGVRDSWFSGRSWGERLGFGEWSAVFITGAIRRPITEKLRLEHWLDGMEVIMVVSPTFLALLFRVNRIPDNVWK